MGFHAARLLFGVHVRGGDTLDPKMRCFTSHLRRLEGLGFLLTEFTKVSYTGSMKGFWWY